MIYIVSLMVFSAVIFTLVGILLLVDAKVAITGERSIIINGDEEGKLEISGTPSLLSALGQNEIFLPSACGGSGSCGMCKCVVKAGGGAILPTELAHLSAKDKQLGKRLSCQLKVKTDLTIEVPESIFGIKKFGAEVLSNDNISTYIKELVLRPDDPVLFKAGSYIQIDVPEYECCFKDFAIDSRFVSEWKKYNLLELTSSGMCPGFRAYSLANPPHEKNVLKMTVKIATPPAGTFGIPPGFGSSYVFGLKPGDRVTVSGPYGDFFTKESDREKCFIGGGQALPPFGAMSWINWRAIKRRIKSLSGMVPDPSKMSVIWRLSKILIEHMETFHTIFHSPGPILKMESGRGMWVIFSISWRSDTLRITMIPLRLSIISAARR